MAHVLTEAGRDPSFLIGGVPLNFRQSWRLGEGEDFVVEGDEYDTAFFDKKSKFLHYRPQIVILTSVEFDHADIFRDEAAVKDAFREFVELIPAGRRPDRLRRLARRAGGGQGRALPGHHLRPPRLPRRLDLRGQRPHARAAAPSCASPTRARWSAHARDRPARRLQPREPDRRDRRRHPHRRRPLPAMARASQRFLGVKRRQELRGIAAGVTVIDDFAHHPTAIRETLGALQGPLRPRQADRRLRAALGHQPPRDLPDTTSPRRWPSPTRWCWPRCTPPRRCRPTSAWTSSGWPPTCAASDVPARVDPHRRRDRRPTWPSAPAPATPWSS